LHLLVLQRIAELVSPGTLGFSILSLVALACAYGFADSTGRRFA
jgi:hypothetical protein